MAVSPCGAVREVSGGVRLVCARAEGHEGLHAVLNDLGEAIARWPVSWTVEDEAALCARQAWHKPHVRREYQTLGTWKAGQP